MKRFKGGLIVYMLKTCAALYEYSTCCSLVNHSTGSWGRPLGRQTADTAAGHYSDTQLVRAMQRYATRASVVTSVGKIKLWQNEVTGNEWWIWPKVGARGRVLGCGRTLVHFFIFFYFKGILVLLMPTVTVASNLIFPPPKSVGSLGVCFFSFFLASLWPL